MGIVSRGFKGRRSEGPPDRVPPGQYLTDDFPVLSAGPTPHTPLAEWTFSIEGGAEPVSWSWDEFRQLPSETFTVDIHCVTKWSKLDTVWEGVSLDTLLDQVEHDASYLVAFSDGGYTTNLPLPHLYFWKSAKWVRGLRLRDEDEPGFWETNGYHLLGDPWQEQRYWGD